MASEISQEYCRNLLEESRLRITSIATKEKCQACKLIMKKDASSHISKPFLDLIDLMMLVQIKKNELTRIVSSNVLTLEEIDFIKEARRKMINRVSAGKSREKSNIEIKKLDEEVSGLKGTKESLRRERERLCQEIAYYQNQLKQFPNYNFY